MTDPLEQLSSAQLRDLVRDQAVANTRLRRLFVDSRSQDVIKAGLEAPELLLVDPEQTDVREMRVAYQKRQVNFDTAPFDPDGHKFRMFPGGLTIWSGFPGSGKTTILRQLVCHLLFRGRGVFVASLEERPDDMLMRLMMTAAGSTEPTEHQCQWFLDAYNERLRMWGMIGLAKYQAVLAAIRYSVGDGVRHAVIDSLTCLDIGGSDWDGQRGLANELSSLARSTCTHIHLVAHPRKPMHHDVLPDIADVAGSSDLGRLADNVVFVQRNLDSESPIFDDATPMQIVIRKQRHGSGMCGVIRGWFHRQLRQFNESEWVSEPIRYLPDDAYVAS